MVQNYLYLLIKTNIDITVRNELFEFNKVGEFLTNNKLNNINNSIKKILNEELKEDYKIDLIEPYIEFYFDKNKVDLRINVSDNEYYNITLKDNNLKQLSEYLDKINN